MEEKEERSDDQESCRKNYTDPAKGFVLIHPKSIRQSRKNKGSSAQSCEIKIDCDEDTEGVLMNDVLQNLNIHRLPRRQICFLGGRQKDLISCHFSPFLASTAIMSSLM